MALEISMKQDLVNIQRMSIGWDIPRGMSRRIGLAMVKYMSREMEIK